MAIGTDFEIQNDKDVRYVGAAHGASGAGYHTVLAFHQWIQGLADDAAASPDDFMDISRDTPSDKKFDTIVELINGYNIDQTAAEHLYEGSIIQASGADIWDGIQVVATAGTHMEIIQNGAIVGNDFWNTIPFGSADKGLNPDAANGISHRFMLKVRTTGADVDGRRFVATTREFGFSYGERKINGTGRGINVVALAGGDVDNNNQTAEGTVATWTTITNVEGYAPIDVNNDGADEFFYSEWNVDVFTKNQFYERMKWLARRGSASTLYGLNGELFRGITHEITVDTPTGTWNAFEPITWSGGTGQMLAINSPTTPTKMWIQLLTGVAPTDGQTITGTTSTATADVNVTITERVVSAPFCGQSTGSAILGAYGFGIESADLSAADRMTALDNVVYTPPNNVQFTINGVVSGEDYVLVGPYGRRFEYDNEGGTPPFVVGETLTFTAPAGTAVLAHLIDHGTTGEIIIGPMLTGSPPVDNSTIAGGTSGATADVLGDVKDSINVRQLTLNGALVGAAVTAVVVNEVIPGDTPSIGWLRILRANNQFTRHPYSAYNAGTKTFTITSHDFSLNNAANDASVYIGYIDKLADATSLSFTGVYGSDRDLFIRVRDGGATPIKTFEVKGTLGSTGGSATASRISDA